MDHVRFAALPSRSSRPGPLRLLLRAMAMGRSQHRLGDLDDHLLRDIGLTRDEARREAKRPSWNAPPHWFR